MEKHGFQETEEQRLSFLINTLERKTPVSSPRVWPFSSNHRINVSAWVGALSTAISRGSAPLVVGACRRGSTRLTAVIGGFVLALASFFTSFAAELHQVLLRWVTNCLVLSKMQDARFKVRIRPIYLTNTLLSG